MHPVIGEPDPGIVEIAVPRYEGFTPSRWCYERRASSRARARGDGFGAVGRAELAQDMPHVLLDHVRGGIFRGGTRHSVTATAQRLRLASRGHGRIRPADEGSSSSVTEDRQRRRACRFTMAERPVAAPAGMTAPERDALLATKLHMPSPRPSLVLRPRLAGQLDEGLARGVILVCAPAGYGKTACWRTGPGAASTRPGGCRWTRETTTRSGSGATLSLRWTGPAPGSATGLRRCSARRRRRRSRAW